MHVGEDAAWTRWLRQGSSWPATHAGDREGTLWKAEAHKSKRDMHRFHCCAAKLPISCLNTKGFLFSIMKRAVLGSGRRHSPKPELRDQGCGRLGHLRPWHPRSSGCGVQWEDERRRQRGSRGVGVDERAMEVRQVSSAHLPLPVAQPQNPRHLPGRRETPLPRGSVGGGGACWVPAHSTFLLSKDLFHFSWCTGTQPYSQEPSPSLLGSVSPLHLTQSPGRTAHLSLQRHQGQTWEAAAGPEATSFRHQGPGGGGEGEVILTETQGGTAAETKIPTQGEFTDLNFKPHRGSWHHKSYTNTTKRRLVFLLRKWK